MKKILLAASALCIGVFSSSGQTAVNYVGNDCGGHAHDLFAELDAGKVVVISFVMPCAGCIGPAQNGLSAVQAAEAVYPGKVLYYIVDDEGDTPCSTLSSWVAANGMGLLPIFSSLSFVKFPYGPLGMPKTVALGGTDHRVIFNEDNTLDTAGLRAAILFALEHPTAVKSIADNKIQLSIFPNPATDALTLSYELAQAGDMHIEITDAAGRAVKTVTVAKQAAGRHEQNIAFGSKLGKGVYLVTLTSGNSSVSSRFVISK